MPVLKLLNTSLVSFDIGYDTASSDILFFDRAGIGTEWGDLMYDLHEEMFSSDIKFKSVLDFASHKVLGEVQKTATYYLLFDDEYSHKDKCWVTSSGPALQKVQTVLFQSNQQFHMTELKNCKDVQNTLRRIESCTKVAINTQNEIFPPSFDYGIFFTEVNESLEYGIW